MTSNQQFQRGGIDKKKIVEEVIAMFPLLNKDHFLYATLDRYNWDINMAIDSLQRRHNDLEREQVAIQAKITEERERADRERQRVEKQKETEDKALKSLQEIFGSSFVETFYKSVLVDHKNDLDQSINYLVRMLELTERQTKEKKAKEEELRLKREAEEREKARLRVAAELAAEDARKAEELRKREEHERIVRLIEEANRREQEERVAKEREEEEMRIKINLAKEMEAKEQEERAAKEAKEQAEKAAIEAAEKERAAKEKEAKEQEEKNKISSVKDWADSVFGFLKSVDEPTKKEIANSASYREFVKEFNKAIESTELLKPRVEDSPPQSEFSDLALHPFYQKSATSVNPFASNVVPSPIPPKVPEKPQSLFSNMFGKPQPPHPQQQQQQPQNVPTTPTTNSFWTANELQLPSTISTISL
eukprot:gene3696-4258_t